MKFTFAAACLFSVTLANVDWMLADDEGKDSNNVSGNLSGEGAFNVDWNVGSGQGVFADPEDNQGWEIRNTYYWGGVELQIAKDDLVDPSILQGAEAISFDVGVAGQWPDYGDSYSVSLTVTCADGSERTDDDDGTAAEALKNIRLEVDTQGCDISNIKVAMAGQDAEYWAGTYGAFWKDMELYIGDHDYSLLDDTSEWHVSASSAVDRDDSSDGRGKEIAFSYYWDTVYAQSFNADHANANADWDTVSQLNFDVNVRGTWPTYEDEWKVSVEALDANGSRLWEESRSGSGTDVGEDVHMQWDTKAEGVFENVGSLKVTLSGTDAEYWAGNYGAVFRGMDLYFSTPSAATLLASKAASSSADGKNFNAGFMAGLGATAAVMGVAAFAMLNRKKNAIEDGAFQRV